MSEAAVKSRKVMSLIACEPGRDHAAFRDRFLRHHAEVVALHCPRMRRFVVDLVDVKAKVVFRGKTTPPHRELEPPPFDVITEMWFDTFDDFKDPVRRYDTPAGRELIQDELAEMGARCYDYLISPVVQWDRVPPTTLGERTPGVKSMFISRRIENMDVKAAEKRPCQRGQSAGANRGHQRDRRRRGRGLEDFQRGRQELPVAPGD